MISAGDRVRNGWRLAAALLLAFGAALAVMTAGAGALGQATTIEAKTGPNRFAPVTVTRPTSTGFEWHNGTGIEHTSTRTGLVGWNLQLHPGTTAGKALFFAGTYPYMCQIHGPSMHGTIKIPVAFDMASGGTTTRFTITLAGRNAPSGDVFQVQLRKGKHGNWKLFKQTTSSIIHFKAGSRGPGAYYFRSRVKKNNSSRATGYSPPRKVVVS